MASSHNIIEKTLYKVEICQNQRLHSKNKHKITQENGKKNPKKSKDVKINERVHDDKANNIIFY